MRPLIYGNGTLLVCADERGVIRDFYYPYAGMENHGGYMRLGLYDAGKGEFGWLENWKIRQRYRSKLPGDLNHAAGASLIGETTYESPDAVVTACDMVHHDRNVFMRAVQVRNASGLDKEFRLFSSQNYHILENNYANTAVRDGPMLSHYKRDRFFLHCSDPAFDQFTTGVSEWHGMEGTWRDAEDGVLEGNVVAHGTVDSTVGWTLPRLAPGEAWTAHFWVCVAENFLGAKAINDRVRAGDPRVFYRANFRYWDSFCSRAVVRLDLGALPEAVRETFKRSLLASACHVDRGGSIIASCDSQIKQQGADYYTYCWPRDAAWVAIALDKAGYGHLCSRTYRFFRRIIDPRGYFRHKYTPSGSLGSTWHPLPMIQIDETATPLYALYRHWAEERDVMTLSALYEPLVRPAADFLVSFLDDNSLPRPSFDLWEERKGVYTYSCACVYSGLEGASSIAASLGDDESAVRWHAAAASLREAIIRELYDPGLGRFRRGIGDDTVDASLFAVWYLGVVPASDPRAAGTMRAIEKSLKRPGGGVARYADDRYQGYMNGWPLCTLWLAQWYIRVHELDKALAILEWCARNAAPGGLMPEQVDDDGHPVSVLPLAWSHSTFALAAMELMEAMEP
jgi:GH15 family glucan-1,4-alpha-glucosidase